MKPDSKGKPQFQFVFAMEATASNCDWKYAPMKAIKLPDLNWKTLLQTVQNQFRDLPEDAEQRKCRAFLFTFEKVMPIAVNKILRQKIGKVDVQKNKIESGVLRAASAIISKDFQPIDEMMSVKDFLKMCDKTPRIKPTAPNINAVYEELSNGAVSFYKTDFDADGYQEFDIGKFSNPLKLLKVKLSGINTIYGQLGPAKTIAYAHAEDHYAGSISKMYKGGIKIWIIIHADSVDLFYERLRTALGLKKTKDCYLRSKQFHPTPNTLASWGVNFSIIEQTCNSVVLTLPGTIHSILNLGTNLNVSMNFAPTDHDLCTPIFDYKPCKCKWPMKEHYQWLLAQHLLPHPQNYRKHGQNLSKFFDQLPELIALWKAKASEYGKKRQHRCDHPGCYYSSEFLSNLKQHRHLHMDPANRPMYKCPHCSTCLKFKQDVKVHIKRAHAERVVHLDSASL